MSLEKLIKKGKEAILIGGILATTAIPTKAEENNVRYIELQADQAAFGVNATEFVAEAYEMPNENHIGIRIYNPDNTAVEYRAVLPVGPHETFSVDQASLMPYITVNPSTLGSLGTIAERTEMPGSNPNENDNIHEVLSGIKFGSPFVEFNPTYGFGTQTHYIDAESFPDQEKINTLTEIIEDWNRIPTGYNFTQPMVEVIPFNRSQEGEPNRTNKKAQIIHKWDENLPVGGTIDSNEGIATYATPGAFSEESFSSVAGTPISPFQNQTLQEIPDAYIIAKRLQNFSRVESESNPGNPVGLVLGYSLFEQFDGLGVGYVAPGANEAGRGFPYAIGENEIIQIGQLNNNGYVKLPIYEPPVKNETTSFGNLKAKYNQQEE